MNPNKTSVVIAILMLTIISGSVYLFYQGKGLVKKATPVDRRDYMKVLKEAYDQVNKCYVDKPDSKKLVKSMVDGMLSSLDPHSEYLPPEPFKEMNVQISGAFGGIGIELGMRDAKVTVISPIEDTPAFKAGVQSGDHIWKIDGVSTKGMNINDAVKRMRGEKGTPVTITVLRGAGNVQHTFRLIRDIIQMKSMRSKTIEPGIGYIRISQFQARTGEEFRQALQKLNFENQPGMKGLILDLRHNPGGLVNSAVDVANCFIGDDVKNTLIVSTKGRMPNTTSEIHASVGPKEPRYPIVVLINDGTASASEIVAGALQDHGRAVIMGRQSFGKGSVQSIIPMKEGAGLKLTTARYYTPKGRSIQAKGIVPDIEVGRVFAPPVMKPVSTSAAPQNDKAAGGKAPMPLKPQMQGHGFSDADPSKDNQLARALDLIRGVNVIRFGPQTSAKAPVPVPAQPKPK